MNQTTRSSLVGFIAFLFLFHTFFEFAVVEGYSMYPTLRPRSIVVVRKYYVITPNEVVKAIDNQGFTVVKRVAWVKDDTVFLVGDNKEESIDSRYLGAIAKNKVKGVIWGAY